jgi:uncharacterized protein (DUF433 family)
METPQMQRIDVDPDVLMGKPVIAGTRIPVYLILNLLRSGYDEERIIEAYPVLTRDDIRAVRNIIVIDLSDEELEAELKAVDDLEAKLRR